MDIGAAKWKRAPFLPSFPLYDDKLATSWGTTCCPRLTVVNCFIQEIHFSSLGDSDWIWIKVTIVKWWMWHFGGSTAKRHYAVSNSDAISKLDRGRLTGWKKLPPSRQTARRYRDHNGKSRYVGTSQLKKTETLAEAYE